MSKKYDLVTIVSSLVLMAALVLGTIFCGDRVISGLGLAKSWVIYHFGWVFIIIVAAIMFMFYGWLFPNTAASAWDAVNPSSAGLDTLP